MSAFFAYGLDAGKPIAKLAREWLIANHRARPLGQNLPVLIVVLWGGFTTNFIWCIAAHQKPHHKAVLRRPPPRRHALDQPAHVRRRRHHLVLPVLLLLHGPDQDGQVRLLQLDPPHGQHHHLRDPVGPRAARVARHQPAHPLLVTAGLFCSSAPRWSSATATTSKPTNHPPLPRRLLCSASPAVALHALHSGIIAELHFASVRSLYVNVIERPVVCVCNAARRLRFDRDIG